MSRRSSTGAPSQVVVNPQDEQDKSSGSLLGKHRVLDMTDGKGYFCGKLLGNLGADVIKVEEPGGNPGRRRGLFYEGKPDPEKSVYWWALNGSKRSVTLDCRPSAIMGHR